MILDISAAIQAIEDLRNKLDKMDFNSDAETEWADDIGEKLVEAQDCLREANLILEDGPDEPEDDNESENDNPA